MSVRMVEAAECLPRECLRWWEMKLCESLVEPTWGWVARVLVSGYVYAF